MSGRFNEYRAAVTATIKAAMPNLRECETQLGRFDLDELERNSVRAPAVRIGVLRTDIKPRTDDDPSAMLSVAAFAICDGKTRDDAAWTIAEAIAVLLRRNQRFGLEWIGAPEDVRVGPVLTSNFDRRGISIVAVEWKQNLHKLGATIFDDNDVVWTELYLNGELAAEEPVS